MLNVICVGNNMMYIAEAETMEDANAVKNYYEKMHKNCEVRIEGTPEGHYRLVRSKDSEALIDPNGKVLCHSARLTAEDILNALNVKFEIEE